MAPERQDDPAREIGAQKPSYGFEGSSQSLALFPVLIGLTSLSSGVGGAWILVAVLAALYFAWTAISSLIGATDAYRTGLDQQIIDLSTLRRNRKALNAVCGTGSLAVSFARQMHAGEVHATDQWKPTKRMPDPARRTRDNIRLEGVEHMVTVHEADPLHLPFDTNYFNAIGSRYGIQNTSRKRKESVHEMLRVVRNGGSVVLAEGLPWALWLKYRVMHPLQQEYRITDLDLTRYHFTFILSARKLG